MYLGLDLGTSGLRGLLVNAEGAPIASATASYDVSRPHRNWSEQDPALWTTACDAVMAELRAAAPEAVAALKGIGVSGHMHGAVVLDADGAVLRPCMLWNDTRAHGEAAALDQAEGMRAITGNIVFPGFTAPKVQWLERHEPAVFARIAKVLLPSAYLTFWLTGAFGCGMSDAAGTAWLDVGARRWSDQALRHGGMRHDQMPPVAEGTDIVGAVRADLAAHWGMPLGVQVVAGAGDNAAAACGAGVMAAGQGFVSLGTSGVLLAASDQYAPDAQTAVHTFCHAVPDRWYQMGVILSATDALTWLSGITGDAPEGLTAALGDELRAPTALQFLPYLSGERTPHNDSDIRGAFVGLDIAMGKDVLTQAVLEGVAFALRDCAEALKAAGTTLTDILAIGGGARSAYWVKLIATVLGMPLRLPVAGDFGAALGAARLAMVGVGGASVREVMTTPEIAEVITPDTALTPAFDEAYERYRALYPAIKALS